MKLRVFDSMRDIKRSSICCLTPEMVAVPWVDHAEACRFIWVLNMDGMDPNNGTVPANFLRPLKELHEKWSRWDMDWYP